MAHIKQKDEYYLEKVILKDFEVTVYKRECINLNRSMRAQAAFLIREFLKEVVRKAMEMEEEETEEKNG